MGGLIVGIFWGVIVSGVVLAAVSLSTPLPPRSGDAEHEAVAAAPEVEADGPTDADEADAGDAPEAAAPEDANGPEADAPADEDPTDEAPADDAPAGDAATEEEAAGDAEDASAVPATEIPLPAGTEFNRPPPETEAVLPAPDAAPSPSAPAAPALADQSPAPSFDTAPAPQPNVSAALPQVTAVAPDGTAPPVPGDAARPNVATAPGGLSAQPLAPSPVIRSVELPLPDAEVVEEEAADDTPVVEIAEDPAPEADVTAETPDATPDPETSPEEVAEGPVPGDDAADADVADTETAENGIEPPVDEVAAAETTLPSPTFPTIGSGEGSSGLPNIAAAPNAVTDPDTPAFPSASALPQVTVPGTVPDVADDAGDPVVSDDPRAIVANAVPFDQSDARPLLSVVLIDDPESRLELSTLTRFGFPVTFAIDPLHPEAAERAAAYREAGFEVAILGAMVPEGATPSDVEVALSAAQTTLPQAVALLDTPEGRIQSDRPILDATVAALAESGHGLLAFPQGLNAAEQSARRADVPGATLFRLLDDEDQRATVITRFLARAAFTASQDGVVIVAGRTRPDTVTALFSWALGERSSAVTLAPLSAALLRASEQ